MGQPESLFYYTNAEGLLGILEGSVLWASDQRFLNDVEDATFGHDLFRSTLVDLQNPALTPGHVAHDHPEAFGKTFDEYKHLVAEELGSAKYGGVYVACFCQSGDLLSQWRGYASDHGYAIEFDTDALVAKADHVEGYDTRPKLTQVRYGPEGAESVLSELVDAVVADTNLGHPGVHAHLMALRLTGMLAGVKNVGFREEREWRLITVFPHDVPDMVRFRTSEIAVVPYTEVPFADGALKSVRVGPGRHAPVRAEGVQRLLRKLGLSIPVEISDIPLRA